MADDPGREDLLAAARSSVETLEPATESDWDSRAGDLEWTCRRTLDHIPNALLFYATHLATRATERRPPVRNGDPSAPIADLLAAVRTAGAILGEVVAAAPPGARAFHPAGLADPSGFAAMGCDEILVHTADIALGLGLSFNPPPELCRRVIARLFPWAPGDADPWQTLLWTNGRNALPDRLRQDAQWNWHCAPLSEWDGTIKRRKTPPGWR